MSTIIKAIIAIIVIVVVILIVKALWLVPTPKPVPVSTDAAALDTAQKAPVVQQTAPVNQAPKSLLSTSVSDSSDTALQADLQTVDGEMTKLSSDSSAVDTSVTSSDSLTSSVQ